MMLFATLLIVAATAAVPAESVKEAKEQAQVEDGMMDPKLVDEAGKVGELSGVAEACGLDWEPHYNAYIEAKRTEDLPALDMTLLAAYHDAAQGNAYNMVSKDCTAEQRKQITDAMNDNIKLYKSKKSTK